METLVQEKQPKLMAYGCILGAAFLWGIIGIWNRKLMEVGISPTSIVVIRNIGSMLLLSAIFAVKDRSMLQVKKEHLKYFFGSGVISVVLFTLCYFSCQKVCSLAMASIFLYTAPSFVVIMAAILWKEPVTKKKVTALVLTLLGCALVCGVFAGELAVTAAGILFGLGAGFFYALYSIFSRYALKHYSALKCTLWMFIFAGIASVFLIRPTELAVLLNFREGMIAVVLVVFSTVLPFLLYTMGLAYVESGKASIIASFEPVVAALAGVLIFGESMGVPTVVGILCILVGVCILR